MEQTPPPQPPTTENKERLKKRILIAEDDPAIRRLLKLTLSSQGYEVDDVADGQLLLDALLKGKIKYDLVITDHNMPRVNGIDALEIIRADARFNDLPIIIHSTVTDKMSERIKLLRNVYGVPKGNNSAVLVKKVKEIFELSQEQSN